MTNQNANKPSPQKSNGKEMPADTGSKSPDDNDTDLEDANEAGK